MGGKKFRSSRAWAIGANQDDVITRAQLLDLGYTRHAIAHRLAAGRLHVLWPGIYAIGRATITRRGWWRAAVLASGPTAALSHRSAAALWGILPDRATVIHVSVGEDVVRKHRGIRAHRRSNLASWEIVEHGGIRVTAPITTLVDTARGLPVAKLEQAVGEADKRDLVDPETLRAELERMPRRSGGAKLLRALDRGTFVLTDSELERRFVPLAMRAGLEKPATGAYVNGFKVDFHWPELGLVVETDGLRYHRTPAQQAKDRLRDQRHAAAGLTPLRFTHAQVRYEARLVEETLQAVSERLRSQRSKD